MSEKLQPICPKCGWDKVNIRSMDVPNPNGDMEITCQTCQHKFYIYSLDKLNKL